MLRLTSCTWSTHRLWNWAIAYATPYLVDKTTTGVNGIKTANLGVKVFLFWCSTCVVCALFAYLIVPETKVRRGFRRANAGVGD